MVVDTAAFSPDGRLLLVNGRDLFQFWEVATQKPVGPPLRYLPAHYQILDFALTYRADGRSVLAWSETAPARLWAVPGLAGPAERVVLWTRVLTGTELGDEGVVRVLDAAEWQRRKERLREQGGAPDQSR